MRDIFGFKERADLLVGKFRAKQRTLHGIASARVAFAVQQLVMHEQRRAERAARVARRRGNPDVVENFLAQQNAVGNAVQRHAAGEAEIFRAGQFLRVPRHPQNDLLGDFLN